MLTLCQQTSNLAWLGNVILVLSRTGLRISEAAALRWSDVDFARNIIKVTNDRDARRLKGLPRRRTKNRRDRWFPIHDELRPVLRRLPHLPDGRVLHGPRGALKADRVRTILIERVIRPLADRFPSPLGEPGFRDGRLHSFRHFFCSRCATEGIPQLTVQEWLGHSSSEMIRTYYHLHNEDAQRAMKKIRFAGAVDGNGAAEPPPEESEVPTGQATCEAS